MGLFVNPDNSGFQTALNAEIYVDKTEIIDDINSVLESTDAFICNSRPRRFGKSMTADMLAAYYSRGCNSEKMFSPYKIAKTKNFRRYLNHYDVIHFDVQWCMEAAGGAEYVIDYISSKVIQELQEVYPDVILEKSESISETLLLINEKAKVRFVIIIDEWDVLIRDEAMNHQIQEKYIRFLRGLFKGVLPTKYIALAYLTGILPIKKVKTQSALNNFREYTMLAAGQFSPYIGFTEKEVKDLCEIYHQDFEEVKHWYDGYQLGKYQIYNPRAVVSLMTSGEFQSYWSQTGTYDVVVPLINMNFDGLRNDIITMLSGQAVEVDASSFQNDTIHFENKDDVLTYLIHLGYLGYDQLCQEAFIPNEELRQELIRATKRKTWDEMIRFQNESQALLNATLDMDEEEVARDEYPALLVELKWNQKASAAVAQIKEKKYPESLRQYTGNILLVGINYDKKTKEYQCEIEKIKEQ